MMRSAEYSTVGIGRVAASTGLMQPDKERARQTRMESRLNMGELRGERWTRSFRERAACRIARRSYAGGEWGAMHFSACHIGSIGAGPGSQFFGPLTHIRE